MGTISSSADREGATMLDNSSADITSELSLSLGDTLVPYVVNSNLEQIYSVQIYKECGIDA
jgi:hypothetical protein